MRFVNGGDVTYCDSFGVEHNPKETKKFISNRNITKNTFTVQAYDSVMCRYFSIRFIDFMLKVKVFWCIPIYFLPTIIKRMTK